MTSKKRVDRGRKVASPPDTPEIAASLARVGWPVFPVTIYEDAAGKRHKVPAVKWKTEATTDVKTVLAWFTGEHSGRWIGVYCGEAGIVVLDTDPAKPDAKTGEMRRSGMESLAHAGLEPPKTFAYPTHRKGGKHRVYAAPKGLDLTIGADIIGPDGSRLEGVDVRSGAGLMVYYGPELTKPPKLAPAPDWLLVTRGRESGDGTDRAPSADEAAYRERLYPGKPDPEVRAALAAVKAQGMSHDDMLESVTELVGLGVRGHQGVDTALDVARDTYASGWPDAARHWDNAVAGSIRRLGLPPATIALTKPERREVKRRNDPAEIERRKTEKKAARRGERHDRAMEKVKSDDPEERPLPGDRVLDDAPLADELAKILGKKWAYSRGLGIMRWTGKVWQAAEEHSLIEAVRRLLVDIEIEEHRAAAKRGDNKAIDKARTLLSRARSAAVARFVIGILAEREPEFDAHPDLLNTPSGVVDLRTGKLLKHDAGLYLTRITGAPYDPKADMTMWSKALEAVPPKVGEWLKIRFGQAATGYTPEDDTMLIFSGSGENGKTGVMIGPRRALGDYAKTLPERLLLADPGDHPTTLMTLMGARLGVIEELPEGRALNVKRLKDTVGTPEITARKMRQDDVTFTATHGLMLSTNYLPIVAETDHGTWRRLALVRFPLTFVKKKSDVKSKRHRLGDPEIKRYFEHANDPGVLRWIVEGAVEWYAAGRRFPERPRRVEKDTEAWRMDADPILAYTRERIVRDDGFGISAADLADDFNTWLERRGHRRWTQQTINSRFDGHVSFDGVERKPVKWSGVLRPSRPSSVFAAKKLPTVTTSWRGVRFVDEQAIPSEAELDAATLADLERRVKS